jgi:recombinational DNA repair protein (RecF pathway)
MNLEGILIHKTPYKDRDIIGRLLLRSGEVVDLYFYGGRGGGKLQKGSILEIGYMLKVTLAPKRKKGVTAMEIAKEWSLVWEAKNIRKNFHAFYLLSFFFEVTNKVALQYDSDLDKKNEEQTGIFKIVSNSLFYLDKDSEKENLNIFDHLFMMLGKLTFELGILPDLASCLYCKKELDSFDLMRFEPQNGGFTCSDCLIQGDKDISGDKKLYEELKASHDFRKLLMYVLSLKFSEVTDIENASRASCYALFNYFCYQFSYQKSDFRSWEMLVAL